MECLIYLLAISHDVVTGCHLQGHQYTRMPVLFDVAVFTIVFANHASHIPHPGHLTSDGITEDDLIGYLFFTALGCFHMNGYLLVVITQTTAHGHHTLRL